MKAALIADPYEALLKPVCNDGKVKGGAPGWTLRCHGDWTTYAPANKGTPEKPTPKVNNGVVVVKCNTWPGAVTFFTQQKLQQNIYCGDGHKFESQTFYPVHTPVMQ